MMFCLTDIAERTGMVRAAVHKLTESSTDPTSVS
jgi:hypothetical protein